MKRIPFLILFLSVQLLSAQQLIHRSIFDVCYSEKKQQPLWLEYEVECNEGGFSRKGLNFKKDTQFSGITSDNADYYRNVWDKGHLAPAADFNCNYEKLEATFNYLNCALQHEKLNRGPWKNLEKYERALSKEYKVNVRIELEFDANSLMLSSGALVPSYFVKILSFNNQTQVYRFPNSAIVDHTYFKDYLLTDFYQVIEGCKDYNEGSAPITKSTNLNFREFKPTYNGELVKHTYYSLSYSEQHEQAEWVFYEIKKERILGLVNRSNNFSRDKLITTKSASLDDYKFTGYDKGHLAPAEDFSFSTSAMSESFYMSNISPQHPSFNRGIWENLESLIRKWGANSTLYVVTGPVFGSCISTIGSNNVCVPESYYKVIYDPSAKKMIAFILPNEKGTKSLKEYVCTVDYLERITNIDFFPILEDKLEGKLESARHTLKWIWHE
jgi:endonuclease G, mitochondrial